MEKETTEFSIPSELLDEFANHTRDINTLQLQQQIIQSDLRNINESIKHGLHLWMMSVGIPKSDFDKWEPQGDKLVKKELKT